MANEKGGQPTTQPKPPINVDHQSQKGGPGPAETKVIKGGKTR